jgi:putative toxin-antitoxin system antitoxin component (TIGR02293 family)
LYVLIAAIPSQSKRFETLQTFVMPEFDGFPKYTVQMARVVAKSAAYVPSAVHVPGTRIARSLGLKSMASLSLMQAARSGLSWRSVRKFLDITGLSQQDLAKYLNIADRTLGRRRQAGAFDLRECEQVLRLAEISQAALDLFDDDTAASKTWLTSRVRGLGNARPIDLAQSEFGAREVHDLIGRLTDGVFS